MCISYTSQMKLRGASADYSACFQPHLANLCSILTIKGVDPYLFTYFL